MTLSARGISAALRRFMVIVFCHDFLQLSSCNQPYWQFSIFHNQLWPEWPIWESDKSHQLTDSFVSKQAGNKQTGCSWTIFHPQIMSVPGQIRLMFKDFQSEAFREAEPGPEALFPLCRTPLRLEPFTTPQNCVLIFSSVKNFHLFWLNADISAPQKKKIRLFQKLRGTLTHPTVRWLNI